MEHTGTGTDWTGTDRIGEGTGTGRTGVGIGTEVGGGRPAAEGTTSKLADADCLNIKMLEEPGTERYYRNQVGEGETNYKFPPIADAM